jgi:hypothetical protein
MEKKEYAGFFKIDGEIEPYCLTEKQVDNDTEQGIIVTIFTESNTYTYSVYGKDNQCINEDSKEMIYAMPKNKDKFVSRFKEKYLIWLIQN